MKTIASFTVDHDKLEKGMYVSRVDGDVITYDIRMVKPNGGVYLPTRPCTPSSICLPPMCAIPPSATRSFMSGPWLPHRLLFPHPGMP